MGKQIGTFTHCIEIEKLSQPNECDLFLSHYIIHALRAFGHTYTIYKMQNRVREFQADSSCS